jgi:hypothetical protein
VRSATSVSPVSRSSQAGFFPLKCSFFGPHFLKDYLPISYFPFQSPAFEDWLLGAKSPGQANNTGPSVILAEFIGRTSNVRCRRSPTLEKKAEALRILIPPLLVGDISTAASGSDLDLDYLVSDLPQVGAHHVRALY